MWVICSGDSVKGCVGACPQKDFTEVLLQRFEALFQVPSSVTLLFICYVLAGPSSYSLRKCPRSPPNHCQLPTLQILQNDQSDWLV